MTDLLEDFYELSLEVYEKWKKYSENFLKKQIQCMQNSSDSKYQIQTVEERLNILQAKSPKELWKENLGRLSYALTRIENGDKSTRKGTHVSN